MKKDTRVDRTDDLQLPVTFTKGKDILAKFMSLTKDWPAHLRSALDEQSAKEMLLAVSIFNLSSFVRHINDASSAFQLDLSSNLFFYRR